MSQGRPNSLRRTSLRSVRLYPVTSTSLSLNSAEWFCSREYQAQHGGRLCRCRLCTMCRATMHHTGCRPLEWQIPCLPGAGNSMKGSTCWAACSAQVATFVPTRQQHAGHHGCSCLRHSQQLCGRQQLGRHCTCPWPPSSAQYLTACSNPQVHPGVSHCSIYCAAGSFDCTVHQASQYQLT